MSLNTRISLGVAFLSKSLNATTSAKCILHAEYLLLTKQYLLTKIVYTHNRNTPTNIKSYEIECENISEILKRLSRNVERKLENGFEFDASAMKLLEEEDETWEGFELAGTSIDPMDLESNETEGLASMMALAEAVPERRREKLKSSSNRSKSLVPAVAGRIRQNLSSRLSEQRMRFRH